MSKELQALEHIRRLSFKLGFNIKQALVELEKQQEKLLNKKNNLEDFKQYKDWCKAHYLKPGTQIALELYFIYKRSKLVD